MSTQHLMRCKGKTEKTKRTHPSKKESGEVKRRFVSLGTKSSSPTPRAAQKSLAEMLPLFFEGFSGSRFGTPTAEKVTQRKWIKGLAPGAIMFSSSSHLHEADKVSHFDISFYEPFDASCAATFLRQLQSKWLVEILVFDTLHTNHPRAGSACVA